MREYTIAYNEYISIKEVALLQEDYIAKLESLLELEPIELQTLRADVRLDGTNGNYERFKISSGLTFEGLLDTVCTVFDESKRDVLGLRRDVEFTAPRFAFCYVARKYILGTTLKDIGGFINRHHSSVLNGISKVEDWLKYDREFRDKFEELKQSIAKLEN